MALLDDRIDVANVVLQSFATDTRLRIDAHGYRIVEWTRHNGERFERRWMVSRGNDWYPVWHRYWAHGGTACIALSQLVRWSKGRPVLPIASWLYWGGEQCNLLRQGPGPDAAITELLDGGYPVMVPCVLCGVELERAGDWWSMRGVSGPCCSMRSGCRQQLKGGGA